jgi:hypothetical protein
MWESTLFKVYSDMDEHGLDPDFMRVICGWNLRLLPLPGTRKVQPAQAQSFGIQM